MTPHRPIGLQCLPYTLAIVVVALLLERLLSR